MLKVDRYILKQIMTGFVLVTGAVLAMVWLVKSLALIELILSKGVSPLLFIQLTLLILPAFVTVIGPITLFVVTLFVYNRMLMDREIPVLNAAGLSPLVLSKAGLIAGGAMTVVGLFLTVYLVPASISSFKEMQWKVRNNFSQMLFQEGEFNKYSRALTVYIRHKDARGILSGILIDNETPAEHSSILAETGRVMFRNNEPFVVLEKGSRQEMVPSKGFSVLYFDRYSMDFNIQEDTRSLDAGEVPLSMLFMSERPDRVTERQFQYFKIELYKRLTSPFLFLTFSLIATAGLLKGSFNRRGYRKKMIIIVAVMACLQSLALSVQNIALQTPSLSYMMILLCFAPIILSLYFLMTDFPFAFLTPLKNLFSRKRPERR